MASSRVVLFIGDNPFYLSGYVNSKSYIRGYVENGDWHFYMLKEPDHWHVYSGTARKNLQDIRASDIRRHIDPSTVRIVTVPNTLRADYNTVINWARNQGPEKV